MGKGIGGHHAPNQGASDEWLTPPEVLAALGSFDLDPCSPINRPWPTADNHYTIEDDGLSQPWRGRIYLNPPYGPQTKLWLAKLAEHGNGVALIFARTDTTWFHSEVFEKCSGILFLKGRLFFHRVDGSRAAHNSGGPTSIISYDKHSPVNADLLEELSKSKLPGYFSRMS